jgi:hypothetical protein
MCVFVCVCVCDAATAVRVGVLRHVCVFMLRVRELMVRKDEGDEEKHKFNIVSLFQGVLCLFVAVFVHALSRGHVCHVKNVDFKTGENP